MVGRGQQCSVELASRLEVFEGTNKGETMTIHQGRRAMPGAPATKAA